MCMKGQHELDDPVADFFIEDLDYVVQDATWRKGLHKRQALDGAGYTWNEFLQWYINPQLACERWCEAPDIVAFRPPQLMAAAAYAFRLQTSSFAHPTQQVSQ